MVLGEEHVVVVLVVVEWARRFPNGCPGAFRLHLTMGSTTITVTVQWAVGELFPAMARAPNRILRSYGSPCGATSQRAGFGSSRGCLDLPFGSCFGTLGLESMAVALLDPPFGSCFDLLGESLLAAESTIFFRDLGRFPFYISSRFLGPVPPRQHTGSSSQRPAQQRCSSR